MYFNLLSIFMLVAGVPVVVFITRRLSCYFCRTNALLAELEKSVQMMMPVLLQTATCAFMV